MSEDAKPRGKQRAKKDAEDAEHKTKRRRTQKKNDEETALRDMTELPLGPDSLHLMQNLHVEQRYYREPRQLPDIEGLRALSAHEAQMDIKSIQHQLAAFEARSGIKLQDKPSLIGDKDHRRLVLLDESEEEVALNAVLKSRRSRPNGVVTPEEIVETLPAARRAVRITQRELREMRIEREDLERAFVRHRCTLLWQVGEMKRMQKQHDKVTKVLSKDVVEKAKALESSRRRTSALQDIMNELEARGNSILRLTREKSRLEALLEANDIELPEIDEVCVGDRVKCSPFGTGRVLELRIDARQLVVELDFGARAFIQEDDVQVLPSDMSYAETEEQLKQRFFEKVGALVRPNGKLRMLSGAVDYTPDDSDEDDESEDESDESSSSDEDSDASSAVSVTQRKTKKRRLIMTPSPGSRNGKKSKHRRVIEFPATSIPITPYETGLLLSPLSELPERVAAAGPNALQWLPSYLPKNMDEWEKERYNSLQLKGEVERLRFQLQKSEAEKQDVQQIASDQLESINQLVSQLDKLRDKIDRASAAKPPATTTEKACPNCGNNSTSKPGPKTRKGRGRWGNRKETNNAKAAKDESGDESEPHSKSPKAEDEGAHSDSRRSTRRKQSDHADDEAESSDAASSQTTKRSLRPRRKAATASPKR